MQPVIQANCTLLCLGEDVHTLGEVCALEIPATPRMMPPPTANPTMLEVNSPAQLPKNNWAARKTYGPHAHAWQAAIPLR